MKTAYFLDKVKNENFATSLSRRIFISKVRKTMIKLTMIKLAENFHISLYYGFDVYNAD